MIVEKTEKALNLIFVRKTLREKCLYFEFCWSAAFGLNRVIYSVNLRIHSECGKRRTKENSEYGHFLPSESFKLVVGN